MPLESWQLPLKRRRRPKLRRPGLRRKRQRPRLRRPGRLSKRRRQLADAAKVAQRLAEENADAQVALAETANMAAQVADAAVEQANADLIVAQDMQKQAEDERDAAVTAEKEAQRSAPVGSAATTAEEQRRQEPRRSRSTEQEARGAPVIQVRATTVLTGPLGRRTGLLQSRRLVNACSHESPRCVLPTSMRSLRSVPPQTFGSVSDVDRTVTIQRRSDPPTIVSSASSDAALVDDYMVVDAEGDVVNWLGVMDTARTTQRRRLSRGRAYRRVKS